MIEQDTGDKVVMVRADNAKGEFGPEFQNRCKEDGMQFEPCPAYKHSLNGVSERAVYTTDCKIRSLLFDSKLLIDLWCLAAEHAIWIKNRVPTIALPFGSGRLGTLKTPYKAYTKQVLNLEHVKAFSCAAYPILPKGKHPQHFTYRHRPGHILVGMQSSKIWKVFDLGNQTVDHVDNCRFDKYLFPWE